MSLRIAVGIPTTGRPAVLAEALRELQAQTRQPDRILVCCARPADIAALDSQLHGVEVFLSSAGSSRQRNRILDAARDCDMVVFFDDDFLPQPGYLERMEQLFEARPSVVVATGRLLADGACGPGLSVSEGRAMLRNAPADGDALAATPTFNGYGCNMAVRVDVARCNGLRFDERLPLYGWQEDSDLSRRLAPYGEILLLEGARGVHLGVKHGRTSGLRFGYSQIANPLYIARRTARYPLGHALLQMVRNLGANSLRALSPEPWVDRRGRLRGNLIAVADLLRGRLDPERVLALGPRGGMSGRPGRGAAAELRARLEARSAGRAAVAVQASQR
jgi:GT2 family glycosyltransferase